MYILSSLSLILCGIALAIVFWVVFSGHFVDKFKLKTLSADPGPLTPEQAKARQQVALTEYVWDTRQGSKQIVGVDAAEAVLATLGISWADAAALMSGEGGAWKKRKSRALAAQQQDQEKPDDKV